MTISIGVVGMTHLGLNYAAAFAEKGFNLLCVDENAECISRLREGQLPISEPQLDELIQKNKKCITFTHELSKLAACDVVFVAYDVPTDDAGNSDLSIISQLLTKAIPFLSKQSTLVLLSQVNPGYTRAIDFPKARLFYQVETLIFGCAVSRALYPERYIIGLNNPDSPLPEAYQQLLNTFDCPVLKMRYESAELAKISINLFLVSTVTTTNTIAEICESTGASWQEIAPALRLDKRIGQHAYLTPGLGIAGGNLERDLNTINKLGKIHNTRTDVVFAWLNYSHYRRDWVFRCLQKFVLEKNPAARISMLGLSYKPNTHSIKNSPSVALLKQLVGFNVTAHDPVVKLTLDNVVIKDTVAEVITNADVVIVMTPWLAYQSLSLDYICQHMRGSVIIDPFAILKRNSKIPPNIRYFTLGEKEYHSVIKEVDYV